MMRAQIIREFVALSEQILEAEEAGLVTREEATGAIDRYRERADEMLRAVEPEREKARR